MPAIEQNIILNAQGGDITAAELAKAMQGLKGVTEQSKGMESQFSHRFSHIGLQLFAGEMVRAEGLGRETRQILGLLQTGIFSVAGAFGSAAGPIVLVGSALVALIAIVGRVNEKHKESYENIQKVMDARQKELDGVQKIVVDLDHYVASGGRLTAAQANLLHASQKLADHLRNEQITSLRESIKAIESNRQKIIDHAKAMAAWHQYVQQATTVWNFLVERIKESLGPLSKVGEFVSKLAHSAEGFLGFGHSAKIAGDDLSKMNTELLKNAQLLAQKKADLEALRRGFTVMGDAAIQAAQKELEGRKKVETELKKVIDDERAHERASMDSLIEHSIKEHQKSGKQQEEIYKRVGNTIGTEIGNAYAKMLIEGKDFTQQITEAFRRMAEQIIADLIRIEVEEKVVLALKAVGAFAGGFASGGSVVVDQPTLFMAGEAGPEIATFTPLGQAGGSSTGGTGSTINIGSVNTTVQGANNPDQIARAVGQKIIQEIRGMGQLNFVRS